jgi:quinol monooxygenase YgiN
MIVVAGYLVAAPGRRDELVARSTEAVRAARRAPGCVAFAVTADTVDAGRACVMEVWSDAAALAAFRGDGPDGGLGDLIAGYEVREMAVTEGRG